MPDVSHMSELLGAGLIIMAVSAPVTVAILKFANNKEKVTPCNSCSKLSDLIHRLETATTNFERAYEDARSLMGILKDIRRHVLNVEGVVDGSD